MKYIYSTLVLTFLLTNIAKGDVMFIRSIEIKLNVLVDNWNKNQTNQSKEIFSTSTDEPITLNLHPDDSSQMARGSIELISDVKQITCFGGNDGSISVNITADTEILNSPGLLISEFHTDPSGSDSPFEWVELIAVDTIDFSVTPYTVIFSNNGTGTMKGWKQGGSPSPPPNNSTYAFSINAGFVFPTDVIYVGGSNMTPNMNQIKTINTAIIPGDGGIGLPYLSSGVMGNGGGAADGIAVFKHHVSQIDSSTIPVDAIFFGSGIGSAALLDPNYGFTLPVNDRYSGGVLRTTSFCAPEILGHYSIRAQGIFSPAQGYVVPRTWITNQTPWQTPESNITISKYTYVWSNGTVGDSIGGLTPGLYTLTVSTPAGQIEQFYFDIHQPNPIQWSPYINNASCSTANDGSIFSNLSGGTPPFQYIWSTFSTTPNVDNLQVGPYSLLVTDNNGCIFDDTAIIGSNELYPTIVFQATPPSCYGFSDGSIYAIAMGSNPIYTYEWSNNTYTPVNNQIASDIYTLQVIDQVGCSVVDTFILSQPDPIIITNINPPATNSDYEITITGSNFSNVNQIKFGSISSSSFVILNDSTIRALVPENAESGFIRLYDQSGCYGSSSTQFQLLTDLAELTLKLYVEGLYYGNGYMNLPLVNSGASGNTQQVDTLEVSIFSNYAPYDHIFTTKSILNSQGMLTAKFPGYCIGSEYLVRIKHRNSIETWIKNPIFLSSDSYLNLSGLSELPTLTIPVVHGVASKSCLVSINVSSDGGSPITDGGICFDTIPLPLQGISPTISIGSGIGNFNIPLTNLIPQKTYYLRVFATNSFGTSFSNIVSISTTELIFDADSNSYSTIRLNNELWMQENLRSSRYRDSSFILAGLSDSEWTNTNLGACATYSSGSFTANEGQFGKLYNGYAIADPKGLCPSGWHIPSQQEWVQLATFIDPSTIFFPNGNFHITSAGIALTDTITYWQCSNPNTIRSNISGFSARLGGIRSSAGFFNFCNGYYWSSTTQANLQRWFLGISSQDIGLFSGNIESYNGLSVRCKKDTP